MGRSIGFTSLTRVSPAERFEVAVQLLPISVRDGHKPFFTGGGRTDFGCKSRQLRAEFVELPNFVSQRAERFGLLRSRGMLPFGGELQQLIVETLHPAGEF